MFKQQASAQQAHATYSINFMLAQQQPPDLMQSIESISVYKDRRLLAWICASVAPSVRSLALNSATIALIEVD
jgi:hypothetical protein